MSDNVIKFGKAKKAIKRQAKEKRAAANRAKFGRTKTEKIRDKSHSKKHNKLVDYHKKSDT